MDDTDPLLMTYTTSRKKLDTHLLIVAGGFGLVAYCILLFMELDTIQEAGGALMAAFFALFTLSTFTQQFIQKFSINIYKNGIEIVELGYFPWEDVLFSQKNNLLFIVLKNGYVRNIGLKWPTFLNANVISLGEWQDTESSTPKDLQFIFRLPDSATNMSFKDFVDCLEQAAPKSICRTNTNRAEI